MAHTSEAVEGSHELGADVDAMILELGFQLRGVEPITTLSGSVSDRSVSLLRGSDGSLLKVRRLPNASRAERIFEVSKDLDHPAFARILARRGRAVIEEWVPGRPLSSLAEIPRDLVMACGSLLGEMHQLHPKESRWGARFDSGERLLASVCRASTQLLQLGGISHDQFCEIDDHIHRLIPTEIRCGFVHEDLAPENVVLRPDSTICVIDNANLDVSSCDFDVARAWYRWPLTGAAATAFFEGYRVHRGLDSFFDHFPCWALAVLVKAANFRFRSGIPGADVSLSMLSRLLEQIRAGKTHTDPSSLRP